MSAGAALSVLNMPSPAALLRGSALGLQVVMLDQDDQPEASASSDASSSISSEGGSGAGADDDNDSDSDDQDDLGFWDGETGAECIFCPGYNINASSTKRYPGGQVRFRLVCDPCYKPEPINDQEARLPALPIGTRRREPTGPTSTYDLNWESEHLGSRLPAGGVRFKISGARMERIAAGKDRAADSDRPIPFILTCKSVTSRGEPRDSASDKRWSLLLKTDPGSWLLQVVQVRRLPILCSVCHSVLRQRAWVCEECEDLGLCGKCRKHSTGLPEGHDPEEHAIAPVDIGS